MKKILSSSALVAILEKAGLKVPPRTTEILIDIPINGIPMVTFKQNITEDTWCADSVWDVEKKK